MANTTSYVPLFIPYNADNRTNREKWLQECIEKNHEIEAVTIGSGKLSDEQVQTIQTCIDDREADYRQNIDRFGPLVIIGFIVILGIFFFSTRY